MKCPKCSRELEFIGTSNPIGSSIFRCNGCSSSYRKNPKSLAVDDLIIWHREGFPDFTYEGKVVKIQAGAKAVQKLEGSEPIDHAIILVQTENRMDNIQGNQIDEVLGQEAELLGTYIESAHEFAEEVETSRLQVGDMVTVNEGFFSRAGIVTGIWQKGKLPTQKNILVESAPWSRVKAHDYLVAVDGSTVDPRFMNPISDKVLKVGDTAIWAQSGAKFGHRPRGIALIRKFEYLDHPVLIKIMTIPISLKNQFKAEVEIDGKVFEVPGTDLYMMSDPSGQEMIESVSPILRVGDKIDVVANGVPPPQQGTVKEILIARKLDPRDTVEVLESESSVTWYQVKNDQSLRLKVDLEDPEWEDEVVEKTVLGWEAFRIPDPEEARETMERPVFPRAPEYGSIRATPDIEYIPEYDQRPYTGTEPTEPTGPTVGSKDIGRAIGEYIGRKAGDRWKER